MHCHSSAVPQTLRERPYDWRELTSMVFKHRRELILANLIAVLGTLVSVPVPLLMPLLVDEVLLDKPGMVVSTLNGLFPQSWHGPILYILSILVLTLVLRLTSLSLGVLQTRQFTVISKKDKRTVSVDLEDLQFAYGEGPLVLNQISLSIGAGEKVAFVGASGGGKTTLVQVILGLYPPQSGQVRFDGVPVTLIGMDLVRDNVATVLQHPALFNDSVRMNLALGRDLPDTALWQALEVAQLRETVEGLSNGLETLVGRGGVRLSGGQRQRLAVARMVLSNPKVVILDEATSALDTQTEAQLHEALSRFLEGRTTIIIAHRLSAVRQADRVYVLEDGRIVEQGRHQDLINGGGLYTSLYGRQTR